MISCDHVHVLTSGLSQEKFDIKSKVIIFDEPLAGLDQKTRQKIINLILNETKNKTVIVITHDKEILPYMDKVINLQEINNK